MHNTGEIMSCMMDDGWCEVFTLIKLVSDAVYFRLAVSSSPSNFAFYLNVYSNLVC